MSWDFYRRAGVLIKYSAKFAGGLWHLVAISFRIGWEGGKSCSTRPVLFSCWFDVYRKYEGVIQRIYTGNQCPTCGLRFLQSAEKKYNNHLDWHFRQKSRESNKNLHSSYRCWYIQLEVRDIYINDYGHGPNIIGMFCTTDVFTKRRGLHMSDFLSGSYVIDSVGFLYLWISVRVPI